MNKASYSARNLRPLTDEQLATIYHHGGQQAEKAVIRELHRRETSDRDRDRWAAVHAEWHDFAHAQYLAAETDCRGHLLSREGLTAGIDPWSLWSGSARRADRYASEELRNFWQTNPRLTVTEFRQHQRRERQALCD